MVVNKKPITQMARPGLIGTIAAAVRSVAFKQRNNDKGSQLPFLPPLFVPGRSNTFQKINASSSVVSEHMDPFADIQTRISGERGSRLLRGHAKDDRDRQLISYLQNEKRHFDAFFAQKRVHSLCGKIANTLDGMMSAPVSTHNSALRLSSSSSSSNELVVDVASVELSDHDHLYITLVPYEEENINPLPFLVRVDRTRAWMMHPPVPVSPYAPVGGLEEYQTYNLTEVAALLDHARVVQCFRELLASGSTSHGPMQLVLHVPRLVEQISKKLGIHDRSKQYAVFQCIK